MSNTHEVSPFQFLGRIKAEIVRDGELIETLFTKNVVVDGGLTHALEKSFGINGGAPTTWYVIPLGAGTPAANWTMVEVAANEFLAHTSVAHEIWVGVVTDQLATNVVSKALYKINTADQTITGAALSDAGALGAATGTLFAAGNFTAPRSGLQVDDEVYLTYEIQASSA
jgi:hypothetical protein